MDIALTFTSGTQADITLSNGDVTTEKDLETAIMLSLFTDRRANDDDTLESDDKRGWWGDSFPSVEDDRIGSRLWLLAREKTTQQTANRAREYIIEALQWLIDDGIADAVNVETAIIDLYTIGIGIEIVRSTGANSFNYQYAWRQREDAI